MLLEELLSAGCYVGIATHDELLIWEACRLIDRIGLKPHQYEFQMLHGVELMLRRTVRSQGHRLRVAVPFGPNWYPYSIRRLRKNPAIAGYVLKAVFKSERVERAAPVLTLPDPSPVRISRGIPDDSPRRRLI
jgi:proline dehydrogenase